MDRSHTSADWAAGSRLPPLDKAFRIYLLRSLLAPVASARWTHFICAFHRDAGAAPPVARVLAKPVRRYLHRAFWPRRRLAMLLEHYRRFAALFASDFIRRICSGESLVAVALSGRRGSAYDIFVAASIVAVMQREGELAIYFAKRPGGEKLCRLSLCFAEVEGEPAAIIGGVQGPASVYKRAIIDATRDLYGLRPKDAVLLAARAMAEALGFTAVHAVSDANHVLRRLQEKAKFSHYDAYWRERGGRAGGPYGFAFGPLEPIAATDDKRDAAKRAVVEQMRAFVAARRAQTP